MNRRQFVIIVGSPLAATAPVALGQKVDVPRIGLLWIDDPANSARFIARFREGMRARGYEVGRDFSIDDRSLVRSYDELVAGAARLAREKAAVILAYGTTAVQAAHSAAPVTPVVMVAASDPVSLGVAASLSRPGGHVTGLTTQSAEIVGKRLELLREIVPAIRRLAVVLYPGSASESDALRNYEALARPLRLEVRPVEIRGAAELESAIMGIPMMDVQGIVVVASTLFAAHRDRMVAAMAAVRIPAVYSNVSIAEAGGLIAFAPDILENFHRAALYVDKILKGAKPADLAIEQPSKWQLVINLKTAKALGMKFPQSILVRADRVIE